MERTTNVAEDYNTEYITGDCYKIELRRLDESYSTDRRFRYQNLSIA